METFCTILAGVLVYVICEYLKEMWLQPLQDYKRLKAEVAKLLILYANSYSSPAFISSDENDCNKAVSQEFRGAAANLNAFSELLYEHFQWGIPSRAVLKAASKHLIGISNRLYALDANAAIRFVEQNIKASEEIQKLLKLNIE